MRKLLLLLTALLTLGGSGAWAESKISKAVAGTYLFDSSNPALTVNKGEATITSNDGAIVIHHDSLSTVTTNRTYAAVVMRVDMPTTAPASFSQFINLKATDNNTASIGLGVTTEGKLKGTWQAGEYGSETSSAVTGEHTIVLLCNDSGTTIFVDNANTSVNSNGLKCSTQWEDLRIESDYVSCVKSVFVFSGEQESNVATFFVELRNVVTVDNGETKSVSENSTATRFFVASGGTLTVDETYDLDKIEGAGDVTMDADQSINGNISTVSTGKLTINEGKTLILGTGDSETNSIESFNSIELSGTIKHNNSKATFNNITVPAGKTGKIFSFDMGADADGFKLAGTTTLDGDLTVCNVYNFQMKVDGLAGSGTWLICGVDALTFDAAGTTSNENAVINVAAATTFTGTINVNNTKAVATVSGNLVGCTIQKTNGTLTYTGSNLNGTTLDGVILGGSARISTSSTVNIKNLAGNNLNNTDHLYAFVGSGTINFYGTNDLTKKYDGTNCNSANIGYGSSSAVVIKAGANVTTGVVLYSKTLSSNAPITVEETATLTTIGSTHTDNGTLLIYSTNLTNNGTVNLNADGRNSIVSALSGLGTLNVASGSTISTPSVPSTMTLTGAGDVVLTLFPTSTAPTLSTWTGAIEFPDNTSATNITDIFNAWGNENSTIKLNDISGHFSNTSDPVNPTLNILESKTLTINDGYSDFPPVLSKLAGKGVIDLSWTNWGKSFNLTIRNLIDFDGTLRTATAPINVTKLVLAIEPAADALLFKTSESGVTLNEVYVGSTDITDICSKKVKTIDGVTGYYVTNKQDAIDAIAPYISFIASGVDGYTVNLGSTSYTNVDDLENAISDWTTLSDCVTPVISINQPTSAFYRIKSGSKYLQDIRKSDDATQRTMTDAEGADESPETIFYLDDNTFVGYKTGYGFGYSVCMTKDTEHLNSMLFTESAEMGKYTIQSQQGTCESAAYNEGYWGVDGSDLSRENDAASSACWTIEPVTVLPVTISSVGFATFYSPVALTLADDDDLTAYVGEINEAKNVLTLTATNVIPENQGVILDGTPGDYNLTVGGSSDLTSDITGSVATITTPVQGAYTLTFEDSKPVFKRFTGETLTGFKAYIDGNTVANVKSLNIEFLSDAISALQANKQEGRIFDLNGCRVERMQKGIYIVNGRKVVIK